MEFTTLLDLVGVEPVFESGLLLAGGVSDNDVRRQLVRWCHSGRLHQLRRGVYMLAPPYRKVQAHPFVLANAMQIGSYVSCESALAYHGLIPEFVPNTQSVAAARPGEWHTPAGVFSLRHLKPELLYGFATLEVAPSQYARVAYPEKAFLDLAYLTPGADSAEYLTELRLQNLETIDTRRLHDLAVRSSSPKLLRVAALVEKMALVEREEYTPL